MLIVFETSFCKIRSWIHLNIETLILEKQWSAFPYFPLRFIMVNHKRKYYRTKLRYIKSTYIFYLLRIKICSFKIARIQRETRRNCESYRVHGACRANFHVDVEDSKN